MKNWARLQEELEAVVGADQALVTVLTWNEVKRCIYCYSREISSGSLLNRLNLPVGTEIRYKTKGAFPGASRGYFVPSRAFEKGAPSNWQVAIVDIKVEEKDFSAKPFCLS